MWARGNKGLAVNYGYRSWLAGLGSGLLLGVKAFYPLPCPHPYKPAFYSYPHPTENKTTS